MRHLLSPTISTPPATPSTGASTSEQSYFSHSDVNKDSSALTPAPTPSPMKFNLSVDGPDADGTYFEATVKCWKNKSPALDQNPFLSHTVTTNELPINQNQNNTQHLGAVAGESTPAPKGKAPEVDVSDSDQSASDDDDSSVHSLNIVIPEEAAAATNGTHLLHDTAPNSNRELESIEPVHSQVLTRSHRPSLVPYRDAAFQQAFHIGVQIAQDVDLVLKKCPENGAPLKLSAEAEKLSRSIAPKERIIGVVGNSGHGKSSLINSLLDVEELAMTDASGTAVTAFVIEYRQRQTKHTAAYTVECTCLAGEALVEQLDFLLEDYRRPALIDIKELGGPDYEALEARSRAARDVFDAAFSRQGVDTKLLEYNDKEVSKDSSLAHLRSWSDQLDWPTDMVNGVWTKTAENAEECQSLTAIFQKRGLWPFIKSMSVYLDSALLQEGLVLADLPGYHDVNFARVRAAKQYQANCDDVFVVADIKRAVDNPIIRDVIRDLRHSPDDVDIGKIPDSSITVVCTHSGVLSDKKLEQLVDRTLLQQAKAEIRALDARGNASRQDFNEADHKYDALLINARNCKVVKELQEKYREHFPKDALPVYCVDNVMYWRRLCRTSIKTSGIPDLRHYAQDLPAQALFKATDSFLSARIPGLVGSFEIWIEALRSQATQEPNIDLPDLQDVEAYEDDVAHWKSDVDEIVQRVLENPLRRSAENITCDALDTSKSWRGMHWASVGAFLRNNGTHSTGTVGYKCWNSELVSCFPQKWQKANRECQDAFANLKKDISSRFQRYRRLCKSANASQALMKSLQGRQRFVDDVLANAEEDFLKGLRRIKRDATSGNEISYIVDYMVPAYRKGACDSGTGVNNRRHALLSSHISNRKFVGNHCAHITKHAAKLVDRVAKYITAQLEEAIELIEEDIEILQGPKAEEKSLLQNYPAYARQVDSVLRLAKREMERIDERATAAREMAKVLYE